MDRISTGNPDLDVILGGGLPANSINIIMGLPGSGKTLLAEQLAFANASNDRPVLYLTTLSEPLTKVITYLQSMTFADIDQIGTAVIYDSMAEVLRSTPERLSNHVTELIQQYRPKVIIFDSFKAIADVLPASDWRLAVYELAGILSAYDTTVLWVGEYDISSGMSLVEFAVADGILELSRVKSGSRDERYLRVAKLRGSSFHDGHHAFSIGRDGLQIFPRLVSPVKNEYTLQATERLKSGIPGLDEMIKTGWLRGTSTLIAGPSGSGKTTLALHFLRQGVESGEPGLLINFQENPAQLRRAMHSHGWNVDELLRPDRLSLIYTSPVELQIDTIVNKVLDHIEQHKIRRVVIDALGDLERCASDVQRFNDYIYALVQIFSERAITSMLVLESDVGGINLAGGRGHQVSFMSDNIVMLAMELGDDLVRTIRVIKSRGSEHDGRRRILQITPQGIKIE